MQKPGCKLLSLNTKQNCSGTCRTFAQSQLWYLSCGTLLCADSINSGCFFPGACEMFHKNVEESFNCVFTAVWLSSAAGDSLAKIALSPQFRLCRLQQRKSDCQLRLFLSHSTLYQKATFSCSDLTTAPLQPGLTTLRGPEVH